VIILEYELSNGDVHRREFLTEHDAKLWAYLNGDNIMDYTYFKVADSEIPK